MVWGGYLEELVSIGMGLNGYWDGFRWVLTMFLKRMLRNSVE